MDEIVKRYVVCVRKAGHQQALESVGRRCDICFEEVWCMPFNLTLIPLCMECAADLPDAHFFLNKDNFEAAVEELRRRREMDAD